MPGKHAQREIKVWPIDKAPEQFRRLTAGASEWLALIPVELVSPELEALFLRWHTETHPVIRRTLSDGSVILAGSFPSASTLVGTPDQVPIASKIPPPGGRIEPR
jgi:hypothetical protein